jgi:quinol monooxygenase YgiN
MTIFLTARFAVRPGSREKCEQAVREFIAYIQANDPDAFRHFFIFQDEAARDQHRASDGVKRFTDALYPELVVPVAFTEYTLVAST